MYLIGMGIYFGEHVMVDGYGGSPTLLNDKKIVRGCLDELCGLMKMYKLGPARVYRAPDNHMKDPGGWSGFVVIAESHIAIHTFPRRKFLTADIYTCKEGIDAEFFVDFLKRKFKLDDVEMKSMKRGLKYPDHNIV
jgi:S-adenosylmethionine decarboxylase